MNKVHNDFETQSEVNLRKAGAWEYSMHPSTRVMCWAFKLRGADKKTYLFDFYDMQKNYYELPENFRKFWAKVILDPDYCLVAHNAYFEQCIYNNILVRKLKWPAIPIRKWRCDAVKAAAAALPRNLGDAGAVARVLVQKDYEGHRIMMKLCKPTPAWAKWNKARAEIAKGMRVGFKKRELAEGAEPEKFFTPKSNPEEFKKLYYYCKIDVVSEEKLDDFLPELTPFEQELWFIDQKINHRGVAVDMPLVKKISKIMAAEAKVMNRELDILTMGLVSSGNARAAILDYLTIEGLELPNLRAATVDEFLTNGKATGDAEKILQIRKALAKSSTAKYQTFLLRAGTDGRVRDLLLFLGAMRTGRWGGKGVQPQNFPRGVIDDIYEAIDRIKSCSLAELKMLYGENLMPLFSSVLRGMFIASEGHELFVSDYNAIECRIAWFLAGHEAGLNMFREGRDPHREMGAHIFNKSLLEVTPEERQVGKAAVFGCTFGIGGRKFVTSAWDVYRAEVTKDQAKVAVSMYRKIHYPVVEMWDAYLEASFAAVENPGKMFRVGPVKFIRDRRWLFIELPSGRRLSYCDPQIRFNKTMILELNGETLYSSHPQILKDFIDQGAKVTGSFMAKGLSYFEVNQKARKEDCVIPKWAIERTYGGKLFENVVQAVSRDLLAAAIVRAEKKGFKVLMHSHDELVSEAPKGRFTGDEYKEVMEHLPAWAQGLPIKAEGWIDTRYRKG